MKLAFYAPMKPPDHPLPSGDRAVARLLMQALELAGHEVELSCHLRTWDRGDPHRQRRLRDLAGRCVRRLLWRWRARPALRPEAWLTYHPYYKSPDWLGPTLCEALDIPYLVAEASHAPSRAQGPWSAAHPAMLRSLGAAAAVISLNPEDLTCLRPQLARQARILELAPFMATPERLPGHAASRQRLARRLRIDPAPPWLVCVAMMRKDVKLASFRLLAEACKQLDGPGWRLLIAGDGPAAGEVRHLFAGFGDRVRLLGRLDAAAVLELCSAGDLFVWPALGEAYGMAVLEAQAAGLPALVGDRPGLRQIVETGVNGERVAEGDSLAFAAALRRLLTSPAILAHWRGPARQRFLTRHSLESASRRLHDLLNDLSKPA